MTLKLVKNGFWININQIKKVKIVKKKCKFIEELFYKIYINYLNFIFKLKQLSHIDCFIIECQW